MSKKTFIYTQFVKEGYHHYPGADTNPTLATGDWDDVSHLGLRHMHYFYFKVHLEVSHDNREVEFIQFRRWLERLYNSGALELNHRSCEMLADDLYEKISEKYPGREVRIDVSEDNINGAYTEYKNVK